jgi:hypothetical protein
LAGKGQDLHGAFTLHGNFRFDTGVATFTKRYPTYDLPYRGRITSNGLAGTWGARRWYHRVPPRHTPTNTLLGVSLFPIPHCAAHTRGGTFLIWRNGEDTEESSDVAARPPDDA